MRCMSCAGEHHILIKQGTNEVQGHTDPPSQRTLAYRSGLCWISMATLRGNEKPEPTGIPNGWYMSYNWAQFIILQGKKRLVLRTWKKARQVQVTSVWVLSIWGNSSISSSAAQLLSVPKVHLKNTDGVLRGTGLYNSEDPTFYPKGAHTQWGRYVINEEKTKLIT